MGLSKVELVLFFMLSCFADGNGLVSLYKDRKVRLCGSLFLCASIEYGNVGELLKADNARAEYILAATLSSPILAAR